MLQIHQITFGYIERMSRAALGFILLLLSFSVALTISVELFAALNIMAMYPLVTALVAWDPVYFSVELLKERIHDFYLLH